MVVHPACMASSAWGWAEEAVDAMVRLGEAELMRSQARTFKSMLDRAQELKLTEVGLKTDMDPLLGAVNEPKRLSLWKELLDAVGHVDVSVVDELMVGFRLVGWVSESGLYRPQVKPMQIGESLLDSMGRRLNKHTIERLQKSSNPEQSRELMSVTCDELARGWISKELQPDELDGAIVVPRFLIDQRVN